eukprot:1161385-Pelagomonas_calceolata.AAC.1
MPSIHSSVCTCRLRFEVASAVQPLHATCGYGGHNLFHVLNTFHVLIRLRMQTNTRGAKLQCSHFVPEGVVGADGRLPCVVYLHCNSGSRRDAEEALCVLIPLGVSVFTLDFEVCVCVWGGGIAQRNLKQMGFKETASKGSSLDGKLSYACPFTLRVSCSSRSLKYVLQEEMHASITF